MNVKIADKYRELISALPFTDLVAGLVFIHKVSVPIDDEHVLVKTFPITCDLQPGQCKAGDYQDLAPDASKKSIIYFEDMGILLKDVTAKAYTFVSRLRCVGWFDLSKIVGASCSMSGAIIANIISVLPQIPINLPGGYTRLRVISVTQIPKTADIFLKYSYDEAKDQFLMYPYDYFAIEIQTEFTLPVNCVPEITMQNPDC